MNNSTDHTTHYKTALVIALNTDIEEDVMLLIDEVLINCFITYCSYEIEIGKGYSYFLHTAQ